MKRPGLLLGLLLVLAAKTFNGEYHDYEVPAEILNSGVTPTQSASWSSAKALYR